MLVHDGAGGVGIVLFDRVDQRVVFGGGVAGVELAADAQVGGTLIHVEGGHDQVLEHGVAGAAHDLEVKTGIGAAVVDEALVVAGIGGQRGAGAELGELGRGGAEGGERGGLGFDDGAEFDQVAEALERDAGDAVAGVGLKRDEIFVTQAVEGFAQRSAGDVKLFAEILFDQAGVGRKRAVEDALLQHRVDVIGQRARPGRLGGDFDQGRPDEIHRRDLTEECRSERAFCLKNACIHV